MTVQWPYNDGTVTYMIRKSLQCTRGCTSIWTLRCRSRKLRSCKDSGYNCRQLKTKTQNWSILHVMFRLSLLFQLSSSTERPRFRGVHTYRSRSWFRPSRTHNYMCIRSHRPRTFRAGMDSMNTRRYLKHSIQPLQFLISLLGFINIPWK